MRVSKRKTLKVDDLNHSLRMYNFKPLLGYESFANAEFEKIDAVNGLWRPKQNIIDLEDYLSKPIVSCPMQTFAHFHWVAIDGKRPNIPENFIRDPSATVNLSHVIQAEAKEPQNVVQQKNAKVVPPIIHNISKELQIFLDNFEQRFHKEIKNSKLNPSPLFTKSKELEVSLNVIESEPGVVEVIPYIIEFLMTSLANKLYLSDAKVHMVILHYVDALLKNSFFYLEPYLHQIVSLVLSLVLMENTSTLIEMAIGVKNFAVGILKSIFERYETKYPNFINQLLEVFKANIVPEKSNPCFLTTYGAIKGVNILGPSYVIELILPNIDSIYRTLIVTATADAEVEYKDETSVNPSQDMLQVDHPYSESLPKISFSMPPFLNAPVISSSIFSEISNTNVISSNKEDAKNEVKKKKISMTSVKKAFYAYYALKESANLILNYANNLDSKAANSIFNKLNETFGESLTPSLVNQPANFGLDFIL